MDIRRYFQKTGSKKTGDPVSTSKETKKRNVIVDSDEDDPLPPVSKRKQIVDSDSDDDLFKATDKKLKKEEKIKHKSLLKPETPKLKPVAAAEFFGKTPVTKKEQENVPVKRKKE